MKQVPVIHQRLAVIRGDDDGSAFHQTLLIQKVEHATKLGIELMNARVVAVDQMHEAVTVEHTLAKQVREWRPRIVLTTVGFWGCATRFDEGVGHPQLKEFAGRPRKLAVEGL